MLCFSCRKGKRPKAEFGRKGARYEYTIQKGVLELCVLSLLKQGDKYGYELADTVGKQIDISEGTIYPLLKRLRAEGILKSI